MPVVINGSTGISGTDGSAATPALQGTDTNTGMFFPAADQIAFAEGGTEVMRLDASGNVGIGTSSPGASLDIVSSGLPLRFASGATSGYGLAQYGRSSTASQNWHVGSEGDGSFRFYNGNFGGGSERGRFDAFGSFFLGTPGLQPSATQAGIRAGGSGFIELGRGTGTDGWGALSFANGNGFVGSVTTSGSSTSYNTTSDYRLKHDVQPLTTGLATIGALKPSTYKWKADDSYGEGFIAHELAEHIPLAVSGEKDAVNEDGSIKPQGVDYSKVVVHLVAAVQELTAKLEAAEARIATLEAR